MNDCREIWTLIINALDVLLKMQWDLQHGMTNMILLKDENMKFKINV